ncbi:hypothetical protein PsYK624_077750 [Phanerochaete sordida]|uniref:BTB domain-containing protein n=1 Tax=Phanerochaete sordida TaxID=48140 RepID=A0A9P3GBJ4_9APHY|nr:hypothetical protein PsYK624_077750 [Phanerochaete sordida]
MDDGLAELTCGQMLYGPSYAFPNDTTPIATPAGFSPGVIPSLQVSPTFHSSLDTGSGPPDIRFVAADNVFFFAHVSLLLSRSENSFNALIPHDAFQRANLFAIAVPELSNVFTIVLHTIYGWSCTGLHPSTDDLSAALTALEVYGVPASTCLAPNSPLHALVLAHAALRPLEVFALAAEHGVEPLAVAVSSKLVGRTVPSIPEPLLERIGARYLLRLARLQLSLMDRLRELVLNPPQPHLPAATCGFSEQRTLIGTWALASARLSWHAKPDLSASTIQAVFNDVEGDLRCTLCKDAWRSRVRQILYQWTLAKRTI